MEEFKKGWGTLLAATVGTMCGLLTITNYTQGFFVGPVIADFGWSPAQFFLGFTIMLCLGLLTGPLIGSLAARYGAREVGLIGLVGHAAGYWLLSINSGSLLLWYTSFAALAVLGAGSLPIIWTSALNGWFDRHLGKAIGITMAGTGLGAILLPPIAQYVIDNYGWRGAYQALAVGSLLLSLPIVIGLFRESRVPTRHFSTRSSGLQEWGLSRREAVRTLKFWHLGLVLLISVFVIVGLVSNFARILGQKGLEPDAIATAAAFMGFMVVLGRLAVGALVDRFWAPGVAAVIFLLPLAAVVLLLQIPLTFAVALVVAGFIGLAAGAELDMLAYLTRRYFGSRYYPSVFGAVFAMFSVGAGIAPPLFGAGSARWSGYDEVLGLSAALLIATIVLFVALGKYPVPSDSSTTIGRVAKQ